VANHAQTSRYEHRKALLFACFLLFPLFACAGAGGSPLPEVTVQIGPPVTPGSTPACRPTAGVTIEMVRLSDTIAVVHATGLQPGERPSLFYSTVKNAAGSGRGGERDLADGADQHGELAFELSDLEPPAGQESATWDIRLVHRRGVACAQITLP
jgi:hypothetical protein